MAGVTRVVIKESVDELKTLMHQQQRSGDKERLQLLYLLKSGQAESVTHASELLGRGRVTAQRWLAKYEDGGIDALLHRQPHLGPACQIPEAAQSELVERLASPEGFASYGEIQQWLVERYNHPMSYQGVHKHVRYRLNAKLKRPRPVSTEQDPQASFFLSESWPRNSPKSSKRSRPKGTIEG